MNQNPNPWRKGLTRMAAAILGMVFLIAAFSKIGDLADFHQALDKMTFLPIWGKGMVTLQLPGLELTLGLCLLSRLAFREAAFLTAMLLLVFLGLSVYSTLKGDASGCHCFTLPTPPWMTLKGWGIVARNVVLLGLSGMVWISDRKISHRDPRDTERIFA